MKIAFTGHRCYINEQWVDEQLYEIIKRSLQPNNTYISGMAAGVDQRVIEILIWLQFETDINFKIISALPFAGFTEQWDDVWKSKYRYLLSFTVAEIIGEKYHKDVYRIRDYWMVDNSDVLIAVLDNRTRGGSLMTYNYAKKLGRKIYRINPETKKVGWE